MKSKNTNVHSDFWLDSFDIKSENESSVSTDTSRLIKMSMARRAVSNFVNILTNKNIPVVFNSDGDNKTDGSVVFLSSDIAESKDFDPAVGLALHEGAHIYLTDFTVLKTIWQNIPRSLYRIAESKGLSKTNVAEHVLDTFNYIEDRYIDDYVYNTAPGYRGYYKSLYDKYFNSEKISLMLKSEMFRIPSLDAYDARILNLTNPDTDLDALPDLRKIAEIIRLGDISRLKTTNDRFNIALEVCEIIYKNIVNDDYRPNFPNNIVNKLSPDTVNNNLPNQSVVVFDHSESQESSVDDVLGGGQSSIDKSKNEDELNNKKDEINNNNSKVSKTNRESIYRSINKQKTFTSGKISKKKVSKKDNESLTQIEKSGVTILNVGKQIEEGDKITKGVECILFKNVTKELLLTGTFPCRYFSTKGEPNAEVVSAVTRGIQLGTVLGRRLKIRSEIVTTKYMRKSSGKLDGHILSEIATENENIFYKMGVDKFKSIKLHISLDASSSMNGDKWNKTITSVTAICKAASMIDNLSVTVSLRTTTPGHNPLPCVGIVYDSEKDSFSKVKIMFPYLYPYGCTPEGLCYEAIMKYLGESNMETECYFLNFSDGQPMYASSDKDIPFCYNYETGGKHTRRMVTEIRNRGYKVLSYFISDIANKVLLFNSMEEKCFKMMYGLDAKFIDVINITSVANTLNRLFLSKT